jgi:hypothetical protein
LNVSHTILPHSLISIMPNAYATVTSQVHGRKEMFTRLSVKCKAQACSEQGPFRDSTCYSKVRAAAD